MNTEAKQPRGLGRLIARGVLFSGGSNVILRFLEILTALVLLRWLSLYEYGVYQLVLSTFELFAGFFFAGLASVVIADVSRLETSDPAEARSLFSAYAFSQIALGIVLWSLLFFFADPLSYLVAGNTGLLKLASFLFLTAPFENLLKLGLSIRLQFFLLGFYKILFVLLRLAVIISFFFYYESLGAVGAIGSTMAASIVAFLLVIPFSHMTRLVSLLSPKAAAERTISLIREEGKWAVANDFVGNIGSSMRPFIIRTLVGVEAVAVFMVAHNFAGYLGSAFPLRDVLAPVFPREMSNPKIFAGVLNRILKYATLAFLCLAILGAVFVPLLVGVFFPKYELSLPFFYLYLMGMPFWSVRLLATPLFAAFRAQKTLFLIGIYRNVFTLVLGAALIFFFGLWGAALEASLGLTLLLIPIYVRAIRKLLPEWRPTMQELFWFDGADTEAVRSIALRLRKIVS